MRILHLMGDYKPTSGGSVIRNSSIINNYKKQFEDDLIIINLEGKKYNSFENIDGVDVYRKRNSLEMLLLIYKLVKSNRIDVIHAHNFRFYFIAYIYKIFSFNPPKVIIELHSVYNMKKIKELISYNLIRKADRIIVLSEGAKTFLVNDKKIDQNKICIIRNGLFEASFESNGSNTNLDRIPKETLVLGYIGSFFDWQGVNFIIDNIEEILEKHDNVYLLMVGNGPEYSYVRNQINKSKYEDRILLIDYVSHNEIVSFYKIIDIFLMPRLKTLATETAIPLKLIEVMQLGIPIVASNVVGLTELLSKDNSVIIEPESKEGFIRSIEMLLSNSSLRNELGINSNETLRKKIFPWKKMVYILNSIYNNLMD